MIDEKATKSIGCMTDRNRKIQIPTNQNLKKYLTNYISKVSVYLKKNLNTFVGLINISMLFFYFCNILNNIQDILNMIKTTIL